MTRRTFLWTTGAGVAMMQPSDAEAQSRIVNRSDGKVSARTATDSAGSTVVADATAKVTVSTATSGNIRTIYADGRKVGTITETALRR